MLILLLQVKNVLPDDAGLSVLKGAVIFGHNRKDIMHKNEPIYVWVRNVD